ncbi:MAG: bifunctional adenosylcobinamide kinase/adenosylcobinamide-phosphate guanylyltransferase [Lachnospiraceae bacterium]|nr:bifunctional adenosylcobinamide kinase/adenosylcobinamide-phosphate guanylyltransferase [Lachnospiraceae bacterium]
MLIVVYGGSGSGKSAYAEDLIIKENQLRYQGRLPMYYFATMQVIGEEGEERVRKHRKLREGKGFVTIEQERDVAEIIQDESSVCFQYEKMDDGNKIVTANPYAILLECMSNLVANEMFRENEVIAPDVVEEKIKQDLKLLMESCEILVVVTNNVFEDGIQYDTDTMNYLNVLAEVNAFLTCRAYEVIEVVAGIPVWIKPFLKNEWDAG